MVHLRFGLLVATLATNASALTTVGYEESLHGHADVIEESVRTLELVPSVLDDIDSHSDVRTHSSRKLVVFTFWGILQGLFNGAGQGTVVEPEEELSLAPPVPSTANFKPIRINCGGGAFIDSNGVEWNEDSHFNTGMSRTRSASTLDSELYQTYRFDFRIFGQPLYYKIPLPNGEYSVVLHFSDYTDPFMSSLRRFDVLIEDVFAFDSEAITMASPSTLTKSIKITNDVTVYDEELTIAFDAISRNPFISAIEVLGLGGPTPTQKPTSSPVNEDSPVATPISSGIPTSNMPVVAPTNPSQNNPVSLLWSHIPTPVPSQEQEVATEAPVRIIETEAPTEVAAPALQTDNPSEALTKIPSSESTDHPSQAPVNRPVTSVPTSVLPETTPTNAPVTSPTTASPTTTMPTNAPVTSPTTASPTTTMPTNAPVTSPTTASPTTTMPTNAPVTSPTTASPTTTMPTNAPVTPPTTAVPTTTMPTNAPVTSPITMAPSFPQSKNPTRTPTSTPTQVPTSRPTRLPTLEPTPEPTQSNTVADGPFQTIRINAGGDEFTDFLGNVWEADKYFIGGSTYSDGRYDIAGTQSHGLYQSERNGDNGFKYEIPVPSGDYEIILHLAEIWFSEPGQRLFNVAVEGESSFINIDPVQQAGAARTAITVENFKLVTDGAITLNFSSIAGSTGGAKVSALEIKEVAPHLAHALAGGPYNAVDSDGDGSAFVSVDGSSSHTHGLGLTLNQYIWRSGSSILGTGEKTQLVVPIGENTPLTLTVIDSGGNENTETTTVSVFPSSFPTITGLSPSSGPIGGNERVTITGSGFSSVASETVVHFGQTDFSGSAIDIVDETTIRLQSPSASIGAPVHVTVETPAGESNAATYTYISGEEITFDARITMTRINYPTVVMFGPDRCLYVGTAVGKLMKLTFQDGNFKIAKRVEVVAAPSDEDDTWRSILGIAFDPLDTSENPNVFFSHSLFFHLDPTSSSGKAVNGKISMASGANLDTITDIVTGLPVSDHDHAINGIVFGDNGELYIQAGGNTNAGVPGQISGSGVQREGVLSAATLVAHLGKASFDGTVTYSADDDGDQTGGFDVEVFAAGQRNPYDIVLHSNGMLYGSDNGPNLNYGDISLGCGGESRPDVREQDKLNLLEKGKYYGHANRKRGATDPRQCVWHSSTEASTSEYTAPLVELPASSNGIFEWSTNHFGGQLRGNLIVSKYKEEINRVILSDNGKSVVPESVPVIPLLTDEQAETLSLTQAPTGEIIASSYLDGAIHIHRPSASGTSALVVLGVWPYRGGLAGGSALSVYGKNLNTNGGNPTVTVGGIDCPVTIIKEFRVQCTLPVGVEGTVDIVVTAGDEMSVFQRGYRYIKGNP